MDTETKPYTIQQMSHLTGVKPVTLRAWERRYGLLEPARSEGKYRHYGESDVDTILRVKALMEKGMSIKQAVEFIKKESKDSTAKPQTPWEPIIDDMLAAVTKLDETALEEAYHRALSEYPLSVVLRKVIVPLLHELGRRWATNQGGVAEEHFFSVYLRNELGAQFHHMRSRPTGDRLLTACLPGEYHETGLLIFSLAALAYGFRVTVLGANMPITDLNKAARQVSAKAIVLSGALSSSFISSTISLSGSAFKIFALHIHLM